MKKSCFAIIGCLIIIVANAENNQNTPNKKIKCYFNKSVNNALSTGTNASFLNTTFPDTVAAYINRAKFTLDVAVFNFTSTGNDNVAKIATAVNNAYSRGVQVRWINDGSSNNTGMNLLNNAIPRTSSPTTSSYGIMHNKFVVIDVNSADTNDATIITGSFNFSSTQSNIDYNNLLIIQNKEVAKAYYDQFNQMWGDTTAIFNAQKSVFGPYKKTSKAHYFNVNGTTVQIHFSPKDTCGKYLIGLANSANSDLSFGIYTFTDNTIANTILTKKNNGIIVRGIMDNFSKSYSPYTTLSTPLGNNMVLYTGTGLYHNKMMIADALLPNSDPQVATGSFNWSNAAQTSNDENLVIIHDAAIVNQYYQSFCKNLSDNGGTACISPLPVTWVYFTAKPYKEKEAQLNWATTDAINNDHFEIEYATDGNTFNTIGRIQASNKIGQNEYSFNQKSLSEGVNYFRIKQVDIDGNFSYSAIVTLFNRTSLSINVFPNPAHEKVTIRLPKNATQCKVYNMLGQVKSTTIIKGESSIQLNVANWQSGNYTIEVLGEHSKVVSMFTKQ